MSFDPHALKLYTDGSCRNNPGGESGYAVVAEYPSDWNRPDEVLLEIGYEASTNNRMELLAVVRAIEYVCDDISAPSFLVFRSSRIRSMSTTIRVVHMAGGTMAGAIVTDVKLKTAICGSDI